LFESTAFPDFIRRIHAGDDQVACELVERYDPLIRCEVRLRDPRLYSRFDCDMEVRPFVVPGEKKRPGTNGTGISRNR
jgi:hypothetical protein